MPHVLTADPLPVKEASFASSLKRDELRRLLQDPDTPATILLVICIDHFGTEMMDWEPDTLRLELISELEAELPTVNRDKIWALVTYLTTNQFFMTLEVFIPICNALSDSEATFTDFDPADVDEMAWAITELNLVDPIQDPHAEFSDEIRSYVGAQAREEGFTKLPPMLAWGTFDADPEERLEQFQEDPVMFNAIWDHQQKNLNAVTANVEARLNRLFTLLGALPLLSGSTEKIMKAFNQASRSTSV